MNEIVVMRFVLVASYNKVSVFVCCILVLHCLRVSFAKIVKIGISTKLDILFKATNSLNKFLPDLCWGNSYSLNPFIPAPADECPSKSSRVLLQSLSTLTPIYQHLNEVISWINFSLVGSLSVECFPHLSQWFANTFLHCHMH